MHKNIALIELYDHHEVLHSCCEVLFDLPITIEVFTHSRFKKELEAHKNYSSKIIWHFCSSESLPEIFLEQKQVELMNCHLIILLTINRPFRNWACFPWLDRTILLIHNSHAFLAPFQNIYWSWKKGPEILLRQLRFLISGDWTALQQLLKKTKILAFPSEQVRQYTQGKGWVPKDKQTVVLPLGVYKNIPERKRRTEGIITIGIPGTIKSNGRNYLLVYEVFKELLPALQQKVNLVLLGRPKKKYGKTIQGLFEQLSLAFSHFSIQIYESSLSQLEYDNQMKEADFLILPFTAYSRYDGFREKVGSSTISGGINDMIRYGIPALISSTYATEPNWEVLTSTYDTKEELKEALKDWILNQTYREKASEFSRRFAENFMNQDKFIAELLEYV